MSVRLHHPPSVSTVVKEKNYSDGSINPCTNACAGGRKLKNPQKPGEDMESLCAEDLGQPEFISGTLLLRGRGAEPLSYPPRAERGEEQEKRAV